MCVDTIISTLFVQDTHDDIMSEWLRRLIRNQLGFARQSSNLCDVDTFAPSTITHVFIMYDFYCHLHPYGSISRPVCTRVDHIIIHHLHHRRHVSTKRYTFRGSIVVSILACHAGDPGSIPGLGAFFFSRVHSFTHSLTHSRTRCLKSSLGCAVM